MPSPPDLDPRRAWIPQGSFLTQTGEESFKAKLPFFSESFRRAARSLRGHWSSSEAAWVFPLAKAPLVIKRLDQLIKDEPEALGGLAGEPRAPEPAFEPFSVPGFEARLGEEGLFIEMRFAYRPDLVAVVRSLPGARWSEDQKAWLAPVASTQKARALFEAVSAVSKTHWDRASLNLSQETEAPISFSPRLAPFELSLAFDPVQQAYLLFSNIPLAHPLGSVVLEPLSELGLLSRPLLLPAPKIGAWSGREVVLDPSRREAITTAIERISAHLEELAHPELVELPPLLPFRGSNRPANFAQGHFPDPVWGDVLLRSGKAYLLGPCAQNLASKRSATPSRAWAFPLSGAAAMARLNNLGADGLARCCWLSQIDLSAAASYLEALQIADSTQPPNAAPGRAGARL